LDVDEGALLLGEISRLEVRIAVRDLGGAVAQDFSNIYAAPTGASLRQSVSTSARVHDQFEVARAQRSMSRLP